MQVVWVTPLPLFKYYQGVTNANKIAGFGVVMVDAKKLSVKDLIEALKKLHGSTLKDATLTEVASIYGVSRQNLTNWMKSAPERSKMFAFVEKAAKDLEWDDAKAFRKVVKRK